MKRTDKTKNLAGLKILALTPCIALLGRGFLLTESTFIPANVVIFVIAGSGLSTILPILLFRRLRDMRLWSASLIGYFIMGASLSYSLFAHVNYYGAHEDVRSVQLSIVRKGIGKTQRGYKECGKIPYGVVTLDHVEREIDFPCVDKELFTKAGKIALEVKRGALGYYIYSKESLIP